MQKIILSIICAIIFSGCVVKSSQDSYKLKFFQSTEVTDFNILTKNLLNNMSHTILDIKSKRKTISPLYVTDFVNLDNLSNKSQLGFILSDELKSNVTQDLKWPIYQIEFSKYLKVGARGTKLMSRDVNDLKYKNIDNNTYALVGTYSITQRQLLLYLKLINLQNGVILTSTTHRISLTDEIINLEATSGKSQPQIFQPIVL